MSRIWFKESLIVAAVFGLIVIACNLAGLLPSGPAPVVVECEAIHAVMSDSLTFEWSIRKTAGGAEITHAMVIVSNRCEVPLDTLDAHLVGEDSFALLFEAPVPPSDRYDPNTTAIGAVIMQKQNAVVVCKTHCVSLGR